MASTPEKLEVQDKVVKYVKKLKSDGYPIEIFHRVAGGPTYVNGSADLYCIYNGIHIEIECKRIVGGKLSIDQIKWRRRCKNCGAIHIVANDFDKFKKEFEDILTKYK